MTQQMVGIALIIAFTALGLISYPYVRRLCARASQRSE